MAKISLSQLETFLKSQCDILRTSMEAAEYKDYIIAMIFIKWANDNFKEQQEAYAEKLKREYPDMDQETILAEIEENNSDVYSFYVPVEARWKIDELPINFKLDKLKKKDFATAISNDSAKSQAEKKEAKEIISSCEELLEWKGLLYCKEGVGAALTRAVKELESFNSKTLEGVFQKVNFNTLNGKSERLLPDELLSTMIEDFNKYKFTEDNFEFPDLLGAAYEYLIKFFAESAGKKGGEFYTPSPVVELMGRILQPAVNAAICDPTVGSGGLLINIKNFVEAKYGTSKNLHICGQEVKEGTYKMCKMNMLFHGITDADIQQGDTLLHPKHVKNGILEKFDIVVANPPFSQNYSKKEMEYQDRFSYWMSTKKQADFMFVQHMVAILKADGRMAVVMPHGVLFRGGEEMRYRSHLINEGLLECIIGLPEGLFYGTGIPACILIINKKDALQRNGVFFINADREYKEGKNQNILRPEDVEKISYVYLNKREIEKYSRFVSKEELKQENYNCNIRRYVDNTPPAENQDVYAHLYGGIPTKEVEDLSSFTNCYGNITESVFVSKNHTYMDFVKDICSKDDIKTKLFEYDGYKATRAEYDSIIQEFWKLACEEICKLPETQDVYDLQKKLTSLFSASLSQKQNPVLDEYQSRGAFAQYLENLKTDFKSIASSGWNATLIPDEIILKSQAADILEQLKVKKARRDEINEKFEEVAQFDDEECEEEFDEELYGVLPKKITKEYKETKKDLNTQLKACKKSVKENEGKIKAYKKDRSSDNSKIIFELEEGIQLQNNLILELNSQIAAIDAKLKANDELESEKTQLTKDINATEKNLAEIAQKAREKISAEDAQELILSIGYTRLSRTINEYLDSHIRALQRKIEDMYDKYTVTLATMIDERDNAVKELDSYLKELGYEC